MNRVSESLFRSKMTVNLKVYLFLSNFSRRIKRQKERSRCKYCFNFHASHLFIFNTLFLTDFSLNEKDMFFWILEKVNQHEKHSRKLQNILENQGKFWNAIRQLRDYVEHKWNLSPRFSEKSFLFPMGNVVAHVKVSETRIQNLLLVCSDTCI